MSRSIAAAVLAAVIAVFSLFGGYRTLGGMREKAGQVYYQGAAGDGMGIDHDLNQRGDTALKLALLAQKHIESSDPLLKEFISAMDALRQARTPGEQYDANALLTETSARLNAALEQMDLPQPDESFRRGYFTDLTSRNDTVSHDPYNAVAEEFNAKLKVFPANLVAGVTGIEPLGLFR